MKKIFDPIRQTWIVATPEEVVRQTWIQRMIGPLQYPKELLAIEKQLKDFPCDASWGNPAPPMRRIDILSCIKREDSLLPLLLIECKNSLLTAAAMNQVMSYNYFVKAPFVALVNQKEVWFQTREGSLLKMGSLPSYCALKEQLHG